MAHCERNWFLQKKSIMKKLLLLLLLTSCAFAQTTYKDADIQAMAGNEYETLLTNIVNELYSENNYHVSKLLQDLGYNTTTYLKPVKENFDYTVKYDKEKNNKESVYVRYYTKLVSKKNIVTKVEIYGDVKTVIRFYLNFWTTQLNFEDIKIGEVVSNKFLTDVATLSFPDNKTAKITVVTAKDR